MTLPVGEGTFGRVGQRATDELVHRLRGVQHLRRDFAAANGQRAIEEASLDEHRTPGRSRWARARLCRRRTVLEPGTPSPASPNAPRKLSTSSAAGFLMNAA